MEAGDAKKGELEYAFRAAADLGEKMMEERCQQWILKVREGGDWARFAWASRRGGEAAWKVREALTTAGARCVCDASPLLVVMLPLAAPVPLHATLQFCLLIIDNARYRLTLILAVILVPLSRGRDVYRKTGPDSWVYDYDSTTTIRCMLRALDNHNSSFSLICTL